MGFEVCFLIAGDAVLWADSSRSASMLRDSRTRWEAIWRLRDKLTLIAHTHPSGLLAFSSVDKTTMAAIDAGLGRSLNYAVVTGEAVLLRHLVDGADGADGEEPWWAALIRAASGLEEPWQS